jgi:hypothetical protein
MLGISAAIVLGCNESNFAGNEGPKSTTSSKEPNQQDEIPSTIPEENCVEGDKLNIQWSGEVKTCLIDEGRTYNFDTKKCMNMRKASFNCDWDSVISEMKKIGITSSVIANDSKEGAKLVSCGQSKDGNRIVAQWLKTPKDGFDCKAKKVPTNITTGCYTMYVDEAPPPDPQSEKEKEEQVAECMDNL